MKSKSFFSILLLTLVVIPGSYAWQNPAENAGQRAPATAPGIPPQVGPQAGIQRVSPYANRLPEGYQPPMAQPQETQNPQEGWPQYPYPQYHNPYYEGPPNKNLLTYAVDWLIAVPSNAIEHFCNFLDRRVFPKIPATHGGDRQSAAPESSIDRVPQSLATQGGDQGSQPR